jgi:hypothetical protein
MQEQQFSYVPASRCASGYAASKRPADRNWLKVSTSVAGFRPAGRRPVVPKVTTLGFLYSRRCAAGSPADQVGLLASYRGGVGEQPASSTTTRSSAGRWALLD